MKKALLFIIILSLTGCNSKKNNGDHINLRFDWIPSMSFAGDIVGMNNFSKEYGITLKLNPSGEGLDPIKMVISGNDDIGIVGLDKLLLANEKGANLIAIAIIDNVTPTVFLSKKESGITKPSDFIGKKIGIQSGGATEFVYKSLMNKLNIDRSKINEIQIGFDMRPFIEDQYDVRPGFIFDEALFLESNNIKYNLIEPTKYGLNYPGRVYFVKEDFITKQPELIQKFINVVAKGWLYSLENPDKAIFQLQKFEPKINYNREYKGLIKAKKYFSGFNNEILMPDINSIKEMSDDLVELGVLKEKQNFSSFFNLKFIKNYHNK